MARQERVSRLFAAAMALGACACTSSAETETLGPSDSTVDQPQSLARSRESSLGLVAEADGYALDVGEITGVGGQAIEVSLTRHGKDVDPSAVGPIHLFAIGDEMSYVQHHVEPDLSTWMNVGLPGGTRVLVAFDDDAGTLVLGQHVVVAEASDFSDSGPWSTLTDVAHRSGVMVERTGWAFSATGSLLRRDLDDETASLTLVRESDGALTYQELIQSGEGVYEFEPTVPGAGDYLAVLELVAAPAFGFYVSLDEHGRFVERPEASLVGSIEEFVVAMDERNPTAVRDSLSARCRSILPPDDSYAAELQQLLGLEARYRLTSVDVEIVADAATVTYEIIVGGYTSEITPDWTLKRERWLREDGGWKRNSCQAGYLDW